MEEQEEPQASPLGVKDVQFAIIRSWVIISILGTIGLAGGIYAAASKTNFYTSKGQLLLRVGITENLSSEDLVGGPAGRGREFSTGIEDEIHMLTGQALYTRLAAEIGPSEILKPADPTLYLKEDMPLPKRLFHELQAALQGPKDDSSEEDSKVGQKPGESAIAKAAERLMKNTSVRGERFSNVISVYHTSSSPDKAQAHCQALVDAFIRRHREQYSATPLLKDSEKKVEESESAFKAAESDYFAHITECKNANVDMDLEALGAAITARKEEIFDAEGRRDEIVVEVAELERQLRELPATVDVEQEAVTRPNEEYEAARLLKNNWIVEKANIQFQTSMTIGAKNERIAFYEQQIQEQEQLLETLDPVVVVEDASLESIPNEARLVHKARIDALRVEDLSLIERLENLNEHYEEQLVKQSKMFDCTYTHRVMGTKMDELERIYRRNSDTNAQLAALSSIDQEGKTNLQVLEPPYLPIKKAGPARGKLVLMGLMGGVGLGVGLALLRQVLDSKLRHPHAVERALKVPLIAVVPEHRAVRRLRKTVAAAKAAPAA